MNSTADTSPKAPDPTLEEGPAPAAPPSQQVVIQRLKWVMCDACKKWRMIPGYIDEGSLPQNWTCRDNRWDPMHNTCEVRPFADCKDTEASFL